VGAPCLSAGCLLQLRDLSVLLKWSQAGGIWLDFQNVSVEEQFFFGPEPLHALPTFGDAAVGTLQNIGVIPQEPLAEIESTSGLAAQIADLQGMCLPVWCNCKKNSLQCTDYKHLLSDRDIFFLGFRIQGQALNPVS
jgi:hypothetical protein